MKANQTDYLELLSRVGSKKEKKKRLDRVLVIDGLNLFFRNFATINHTNNRGHHIGGLGGFLKSLTTLVETVKPTEIYVVFDGMGSTVNRNNLVVEYKKNRGIRRITNWDIFENYEEESEAKENQIVRLVQYLLCLPIKVAVIDKAEADDLISYICQKYSKEKNIPSIIVSNDQDYLQIVDDNITLYKPSKKEFCTPSSIREEYGILPENFLLYKVLLGDSADNLKSIKGLGPKTIKKLFPELSTKKITLEELYGLCIERLGTDKFYGLILHNRNLLDKFHRVMDLSEPFLNDQQREYLEELVEGPRFELQSETLEEMWSKDGLQIIIRSMKDWINKGFRDI